jgi:hypothetical protein
LELVVVMVVVSCGSALEREKDAKRFLWMVDVWPLREIKTKNARRSPCSTTPVSPNTLPCRLLLDSLDIL